MSKFTPEFAREFVLQSFTEACMEFGLDLEAAKSVARAAFDHVMATHSQTCRHSPGAFVKLVADKASELCRDREAQEALFR